MPDLILSWSKGSPPHTRGQAKALRNLLRQAGITPAHAGTSTLDAHGKRMVEDHPRTRGDKLMG